VPAQGSMTPTRAAVVRLRALSGPSPQPPPPSRPLGPAARSVTGAGLRAWGLSGELAHRHQGFVGQAARAPTADAHDDTTLHQPQVAALIQAVARV
jgi:hypothetical protein